MPALPNNVSFLGACAPTCANSGHTALVNPTKLSGINGAFYALNVSGSSGVTIDGFDISQPDMCTKSGSGGVPGGTISSWTITGGNLATFQYSNTATNILTAGSWIQLSSFGTSTFFNGQWVQVLSTGLSTSQFEVNFTHANGSATESGGFGINCVNGLNNYMDLDGLLLSYNGGIGPMNSNIKELQIHGLANEAVTGGRMNILGNITAWSISGSTATFTGPNTLSTGNTIELIAFPTSTFFNAHTCTVLSSGLSSSQFEVSMPSCTPAITGSGSATEAGSFGNPAGTMNFSDIYIYANANTGWDGDSGYGGDASESVGTMTLNYINTYWNGCMEVKPNGGTIGGNGVNLCVDQGFNGNGDNIVMISTGGTWNWNHVITKWGMQDGVDLLHINDDLTNGVVANMLNLDSEGNEGQAYKIGGTGTLANARLIGNCRRMLYPFSPNPTGYNNYLSQSCRAFNAVSVIVSQGKSSSITNSTIVGYANPLVDYDCYGANPANCPVNTYVATFENNIMYGYADPYSGNPKPGGLYFGYLPSDPFSWTGAVLTNNLYAPNTIKVGQYGSLPSSGCPQDPNDVNYVCADPLMLGESVMYPNTSLDNFNINLNSGSPAIGAGVNNGVSPDFNGNARTAPYTIGAVN